MYNKHDRHYCIRILFFIYLFTYLFTYLLQNLLDEDTQFCANKQNSQRCHNLWANIIPNFLETNGKVFKYILKIFSSLHNICWTPNILLKIIINYKNNKTRCFKFLTKTIKCKYLKCEKNKGKPGISLLVFSSLDLEL